VSSEISGAGEKFPETYSTILGYFQKFLEDFFSLITYVNQLSPSSTLQSDAAK